MRCLADKLSVEEVKSLGISSSRC